MEEVTNMLQRMRELALQAANDTNSDLDRRYIQDEIDQLAAEIDRVSDTTQFNSINVWMVLTILRCFKLVRMKIKL